MGAVKGSTVVRPGDGDPSSGGGRCLDDIVGGDAILELAGAVAPPDDFFDQRRSWEVDLNPSRPRIGDPAAVVAGSPVDEVFEFMCFISGQRAGGARGGAIGGQGDVMTGVVVNLQLVEARFSAAGGVDGEPNRYRFHRGQDLLVAQSLNRGPQSPFGRARAGCGGGGFLPENVERRGLGRFGGPRFCDGRLGCWVCFFAKRAFAVIHSGEDCLHGKIIFLENRIELVIVAPCAAHGEPHEGGAGGVDDVGQFLLALHERKGDVRRLDDVVCAGDEKPGGGIRVEGIACDLLADELIVRGVGIK